MMLFRTLAPFAVAAVLTVGAPATAPPPAQAQVALKPCGERKLARRTVNGRHIHIYRIRPKVGSTCAMNMNIGGNVKLHRVRVTRKPGRGKLVRVRRNQILYRAGKSTRETAFGISFEVTNLSGRGWVNIAVQVQPRR